MESKSIHCTLTDHQLIAKADQQLDELIKSGGKSFTMSVPARPNEDTDLIFAEVVNRFKGLKAKADKMEQALDDIASQRTCAEQEADEDMPIGSDGTRLGDIEYAYDECIRVAREAVAENEKEVGDE